MNTTQRHLLATELDRVERYGWTVLESAVVPATRNLLGARRDVAVVMCDSGDDHHGRYHLSLTAADMFAGSHSRLRHARRRTRPLPHPHRPLRHHPTSPVLMPSVDTPTGCDLPCGRGANEQVLAAAGTPPALTWCTQQLLENVA